MIGRGIGRPASNPWIATALWCGAALALGTATLDAACRDNDGDGYAADCCLGGECGGQSNSDATVHELGREICDGKNNDCLSGTADGAAETGETCHTGLTGACAVGTLQCEADGSSPSGFAVRCVPATAAEETCDCADNDCDGQTDETCPDADGDGYASVCDCDDADRFVHAGGVDGSMKPYCFQFDPVVILDPTPVNIVATIRVSHPDGVYSVEFVEDNDEANRRTLFCLGQTSCTVNPIVSDHGASRLFSARLNRCADPECAAGVLVASKIEEVPVVCQKEFCATDPLFVSFFDWMRQHGYHERVVARYVEYNLEASRRARQKEFLRVRGTTGLADGFAVHVVDVLQQPVTGVTTVHRTISDTDPAVPDCIPCSIWPRWCLAGEKADWRQLERLFNEIFGIALEIVYEQRTVDYLDPDGVRMTLSGGMYNLFPQPGFLDDFPPHSIVHFALQSYDGVPIQSSGAVEPNPGNVAWVSYEPNDSRVLGTASQIVRGTESFTHEWGHTFGLRHSFVEFPAPGIPVGRPVGLDGVMDNDYTFFSRPPTRLMDPADPLERYALEPFGGYGGDPGFGAAYSTGTSGDNGILGTDYAPVYDTPLTPAPVDPAIAGGTVADPESTGPTVTFVLSLRNNGLLPAGYVRLTARDGTASGPLLGERTIMVLKAGETREHRFTLGRSAVASGQAVFVLDEPGLILERDETNNSIVLPLPAPADVEHFTVAGSCLDGVDNDGDGLTDAQDDGCPTTVTAVGEVMTSGTIVQGNYEATRLSDDVREGLREGGSGAPLIHTWRFENVQPGTSHELILEGYRPRNSNGDDFQFSFFVGAAFDAGTVFTDIPEARISKDFELQGGAAHLMSPEPISGTVFIRVRDTAGGNKSDTVYVDYLAVRANP
jgi:hypothetical protein